jgi:aspartate/methionine/tyrosine aminotransferase
MNIPLFDSPLFRTMSFYEQLDIDRRVPNGRPFVSDYNGAHPLIEHYLGDLATTPPIKLGDVTKYACVDEDEGLHGKLARMHTTYDGAECSPEQIIPCGGSSAAIVTLCWWLNDHGYDEVRYLPPLYYKFAYWLKHYKIRPIPVSARHVYQSDFSIDLPAKRTALIFTDPAWHAGYRVPAETIEQIRKWQEATGSIAIVDGTFQYMRWDKERSERSARLISSQTYRLVCPTKFVSIHGYRSSHLIVPPDIRRDLADLSLNLHGEVSASDKLFAHRIADLMLTEGNGALVDLMKANFARLKAAGAIGDHIPIEAGFFLFAAISKEKNKFLYLDQDAFELSGYPNQIRINLMNEAAINALIG